VVPVSRLLLGLASVAMPARVTGSAPQGAAFRETRTRNTVRVPAGNFAVNLAPGEYSLDYGGAVKRMSFLAGARYRLPLEGRHAVDVELSSRRLGPEEVEIGAVVRGTGAHRIELRTFGGAINAADAMVDLGAGREQRLTWKLALESREQAWAVVAIPDGNMSGKTEIFGAPPEPAMWSERRP